MGLLLIIVPLIESLGYFMLPSKRSLFVLNVLGSALLLTIAAYITFQVHINGPLTYPWLNGFFYIDALSILVLDITVIIGLLVAVYSIGYIGYEYKGTDSFPRVRLFYALKAIFIFTMIMVTTTQNFGLMWIALEATTLASVFLVGFANNKRSLEAAWKYIIICSVGIALAFLGIILLYFSSLQSAQNIAPSLNWTFLLENSERLHQGILKIAFIFILVGFGTKAGLVPMHTWLPDAHSEAPSPISALLSGVLLNNAMYGIIRFLSVIDKSLHDSLFTGRLMIFLGLLSLSAAAIFILAQKDYKRLLAYSSIEHMGIISLALGIFTPVSLFAAFLHMFNHSMTKALLFLASGNIFQRFKSKDINHVRGLLKIMPLTGGVFFLGAMAISGLPPFSIFFSELAVTIAIFSAGHQNIGILFILLLAFVFSSIAYTLFRIFFGSPKNLPVSFYKNRAGDAVLIVLIAVVSISGLFLPEQIVKLINAAVLTISGGGY